MSTWIESHNTLRDHPKTRKLCRIAAVDVPTAIGYLHMFWWWCMDYAPDGDLSEFEDADIDDGIGWAGDASFVTLLTGARFIDSNRHVHDWEDYGEKLFRRRQANAERMRKARAEHVSRTCNTRVELEDRTGQDRQDRQDRTEGRTRDLPALAMSELPESGSTRIDYARTIERHRARLSDSQIERIIYELAEWRPTKPPAKLHLTLNKWLAKEQPGAKSGNGSSADPLDFITGVQKPDWWVDS